MNYAKAWAEFEINPRTKVRAASAATAQGDSPREQAPGLYQSFPAEDVAVEADPVFREVESALKKNVSLECAGVICGRMGDGAQGQGAFSADQHSQASHPPTAPGSPAAHHGLGV